MRDIGKFKTFEGAFIKLFNLLEEDIEKDEGISLQLLESATWIHSETAPVPNLFYDCRDDAIDSGLLVDGELNEEMVKIYEE